MRRLLRYLLSGTVLLAMLAAAVVGTLRHAAERVATDGEALARQLAQPARTLEAWPPTARCRDHYPHKRAWFGALHVHTAASYDATAFGVTTTVDAAYAFARGRATPLRLRGDAADAAVPVLQLDTPLDFMAVTDHAEALGENALCLTPDAPAYDTLVCRLFRGDWRLPLDDAIQPLLRLATLAIFGQDRSARVCGAAGERCRERALEVWQENQRVTEAWLDRSAECSFTTFHAYEYTLAEEASNLHRNVIFAGASVPQVPLSAKEAPQPGLLHDWLWRSCIEGSAQCDALAIPHNSNWSSGRMWFPLSRSGLTPAEQQRRAQLRARLEPLAEIMQVKGDSECRNGIASVLGARDEFCDFEKLRPPTEPLADCGDAVGSGGMMLQGCISRYSYLRYALAAGLTEHQRLGVNPFKLGIVAATDTHNGTPAAALEHRHLGAHGTDRDARQRLRGQVEVPGGIATGSPVRYNPGGIAGIYAGENSRQALFDAMRRRETFGTSGPRIEPRLFAGWDLDPGLCEQPDWLGTAYRQGVPMGGDLPRRTGAGGGGPVFIAAAARDPRALPLQRIQLVKAWVDSAGAIHQAVYDVAGDPDNGAGVDTATCQPHGDGFDQLCASWRDPAFDPGVAAVYYARVLENPSCRWSTRDCNGLPAADRPSSCSDPTIPATIQERAWTSPIWYQPDGWVRGS
jgi:hypothetical protein